MTPDVAVFPEEALTRDDFLGGRLSLYQPRKGYRAGVDPVLLAAATPAEPGARVLELGCGVGTALFCLAARVPGLDLTGVERQAAYAALAERNAAENALTTRIFAADLSDLPAGLRQESFDHVLANPPYYDPARRAPATDAGREAALAEETPLALWVRTAARRLAPGGVLSMIHRVERLPELLAEAKAVLGSLEIKPLAPRQGRPASRVLLRARKGGRAAFRLHPPLVLHAGGRHERDGEDYTAALCAILRGSAPLDFAAAG